MAKILLPIVCGLLMLSLVACEHSNEPPPSRARHSLIAREEAKPSPDITEALQPAPVKSEPVVNQTSPVVERGNFLGSLFKKREPQNSNQAGNANTKSKQAKVNKSHDRKNILSLRGKTRSKYSPVELFTTKSCAECVTMQKYLRELKIPVKVYNIEKKGKGRELYYSLGGNGAVPLAHVGNQIIYGYQPQQVAYIAMNPKKEEGDSPYRF